MRTGKSLQGLGLIKQGGKCFKCWLTNSLNYTNHQTLLQGLEWHEGVAAGFRAFPAISPNEISSLNSPCALGLCCQLRVASLRKLRLQVFPLARGKCVKIYIQRKWFSVPGGQWLDLKICSLTQDFTRITLTSTFDSPSTFKLLPPLNKCISNSFPSLLWPALLE